MLYRLIEADHYKDKNVLIVGGGDSAIEAAMGLAHQPGNRVTISYRSGEFSRLKDRNLKRLQEHIRNNTIEVVFNSAPIEFRLGSVVLQSRDTIHQLPNDFVWIFAGGTSPTAFLKSAGATFGSPQTH